MIAPVSVVYTHASMAVSLLTINFSKVRTKYEDEKRKVKVNPKIVRSVLLDGNLI